MASRVYLVLVAFGFDNHYKINGILEDVVRIYSLQAPNIIKLMSLEVLLRKIGGQVMRNKL